MIVLINTAPDDTVDELDFSLFTSSELDYDDLANLSLDEPDMELVIDISDAQELEERSIARFA